MRRVRTAVKVSFVVVGGLAGGALGAGTLLLAVGVGPVVASVLGRLEPLRERLQMPLSTTMRPTPRCRTLPERRAPCGVARSARTAPASAPPGDTVAIVSRREPNV